MCASMGDNAIIRVFCPNCGKAMDVTEREANSERPPCCCEDCEIEFDMDNPPKWIPDQHYRAGYDYACGYHD